MIEMHGKYNSANIMIDELDESTKEQIQKFLNHPAFSNSYIAIMPDCHKGNGSCIGFTMSLNDYIIPNVIGVDIGCGMSSVSYDVDPHDIDIPALDSFIKKNIPSGFSIHNNEQAPHLEFKELIEACSMIKYDIRKARRSLGTLGGGNHFIEAGVNKAGRFCITIHTGSRNFGKMVAEHFQREAVKGLERYLIQDIDKELAYIPIGTSLYNDYSYAMRAAQTFASINRHLIFEILNEFLPCFTYGEYKESVHNFIDFNDKVIRKGATSAHEGEEVIIPFNMRDGIAIGVGRGSKKYNYSAPHGAGRILSRTKAKSLLNVDDFQKQMQEAGVYTTTANESTLDEAPGAYKDMQTILDNIRETVEIVDFIKPIYNFKAGGD